MIKLYIRSFFLSTERKRSAEEEKYSSMTDSVFAASLTRGRKLPFPCPLFRKFSTLLAAN